MARLGLSLGACWLVVSGAALAGGAEWQPEVVTWTEPAGAASAQGKSVESLASANYYALQAINPKSWIFVLGALTTFRPASLPVATGTLLVAGTMVLVILPTASAWAIGGELIDRLLASSRARRAVSLALAGLLVLTIVSVWV